MTEEKITDVIGKIAYDIQGDIDPLLESHVHETDDFQRGFQAGLVIVKIYLGAIEQELIKRLVNG